MSGLLRRIRRPGAATDETRTAAMTPAEPAAAPATSPAPGEPTPVPALPAGVDPAEIEGRPTTRRRGPLRRRARYLRRARELMLRDVGGLVYESRRREQDATALLDAKLQRLAAVDGELRELDEQLGRGRTGTVLREPGVGGTCPACGELHPSDARFCAHCGSALTARDAKPAEQEPAAEANPAEATEQAGTNGRPDQAASAPAPDRSA